MLTLVLVEAYTISDTLIVSLAPVIAQVKQEAGPDRPPA